MASTRREPKERERLARAAPASVLQEIAARRRRLGRPALAPRDHQPILPTQAVGSCAKIGGEPGLPRNRAGPCARSRPRRSERSRDLWDGHAARASRRSLRRRGPLLGIELGGVQTGCECVQSCSPSSGRVVLRDGDHAVGHARVQKPMSLLCGAAGFSLGPFAGAGLPGARGAGFNAGFAAGTAEGCALVVLGALGSLG